VITVLCGGVGGSRFLRALTSVVEPESITAIVNTGDDDVFHGLYVSPDPDIVTYALAGEVDEERGWGLRGDSFRWLRSIERFGEETWFQIGDRDLATHLHRTRLLDEGHTLSDVVIDIARALGVRVRLQPMSDDPVRTIVETDAGLLPFQEYLVKRRARDNVRGVRHEGAARARPAPGVLDAIAGAQVLFIAPSNPIGSIGPILAVSGVRDAVAACSAPRIAVSPVVGRRSLQPPAAEMLHGLGYEVSPAGVAEVYAGLIDAVVIDEQDARDAPTLEARGLRVLIVNTIMKDDASRATLGSGVLAFANALR
jgi:LPPG:FO 2-phospho-L-lactate transferase